MGRKRLEEDEKKDTFHLYMNKNLIEKFKKEMQIRDEIPSRIIEKLIKNYLKKLENDEK